MNLSSIIDAPAKINLGLLIPFKYPNQYHHIVSSFIPIDLKDTLTFKEETADNEDFHLTWKNHLPEFFKMDSEVFESRFKENLLYKTFLWIKEFLRKENFSLENTALSVHIDKNIPSPGGLGGGSSDAASMIEYFLGKLKNIIKPDEYKIIYEKIQKESLMLGADIPFFLDPKTSLISGIGETHSILPEIYLKGILAVPSFGFSTSEMFKELKKPVLIENLDKSYDSYPIKKPKKSLQHDKLFPFSLHRLHKEFEIFYDYLENFQSKTDIPVLDWIERENNRTLFVHNEFYPVIKKLYPEKHSFLEELRKASCESLMEIPGVPNPIVTSMSGSGSSVFSSLVMTNKLTSDIDKEISLRIKKLSKKYPKVIWLKFCSLN